jgi:2-iminoacetate synthase ThiH
MRLRVAVEHYERERPSVAEVVQTIKRASPGSILTGNHEIDEATYRSAVEQVVTQQQTWARNLLYSEPQR